MKKRVMSQKADLSAGERFYELLARVPESAAAWAERQSSLQGWRSDPCFEPFWPAIDQMLTDDFAAYQRRAPLAKPPADLEGYDFDAYRRQREYDLKHALDHIV